MTTASAQTAMFSGAPVANRGDVICDLTTGVATGVGAGTCVAHPATCNGVADDVQAFADFNTWMVGTWQAAHTGLVELFIPSGKVCRFLGLASATVQDPGCSDPNYPYNCSWNSSRFAKGAVRLLVNFPGATLKDDQLGTAFFYTTGGDGVCHHGIADANGCTARLATVTLGATSVTLLNTSLCSRYSSGQWVIVTGYDEQGQFSTNSGFGYPPNPAFYDYAKVVSTASCAGSGVITIDRAVTNAYKSTWPSNCPGGLGEADCGGPATLYGLPYWWDTQVEYRGGTIDQVVQTNDQGRSVTYRNVTMAGVACAYPTQNIDWIVTGGDWSGCDVEMDKIVVNATFSAVNVATIGHQSMSPRNVSLANVTTGHLNGSPRNITISNSTITTLATGPLAFGRVDSASCTVCVITNFQYAGPSEAGTVSAGTWALTGQAGGPFNSTMSAGIITIPNTHGAVTWAVPGTNFYWSYSGLGSAYVYQVTDITQDATNQYVTTNCVGAGTICGTGGGLPLASGALSIHVHPAPQFTCITCSGSVQAGAFVGATPGAPLFSYAKKTYDETWPISSTDSVLVWGKVSTLTYAVANQFAGGGSLSFFPFYQFGFTTLKIDNTTFAYTPQVDLKTNGSRVVTPSGVTGSVAGDCAGSGSAACLAVPSAVWLTGITSPNISAHPGGTETIAVTIQTDQGVVLPYLLRRDIDRSLPANDNRPLGLEIAA